MTEQLILEPGGGINADGRGYRAAKLADQHGKWGYGPGAGFDGMGGSYGGLGGRGQYSSTGYGTYGSSNAPVHAGSASPV